MSEWASKLKTFLGDSPKTALTITDNGGAEGPLSVIVSPILGESAEKIIEGAGSTGPNIEPSMEDFLEQLPNSGTDNNRQLESQEEPISSEDSEILTDLTAWDLLRADFTFLLEQAIEPDDARGSITVKVETGGMVLPLNLRDKANIIAAVKRLIEKYPDPLEVAVHAEHGDSLHLRSRHTRRMARPLEPLEA